jgi:hypothetical protein
LINRLALACLAAAALGFAAPVAAQEGGPPPALVDDLTAAARSNLSAARMSGGSQVPAETPEELAQPLVPRSLEVQTIERALLSAAIKACGLDYVALNYLPYMAKIRASGRYSDKQIAYIGLLHGISTGYLGRDLDTAMCTDAFSADMTSEAATVAIETP